MWSSAVKYWPVARFCIGVGAAMCRRCAKAQAAREARTRTDFMA